MKDPNDSVTHSLKAHLALLFLVTSCGGNPAPTPAEVSAPDASDSAVPAEPEGASPEPEAGVVGPDVAAPDASATVEAEAPDVAVATEPAPEAGPDATAPTEAAGPELIPDASTVIEAGADAGQEAEAAPPMCAERAGTFSDTSLEHPGGNCGPIPEQIYSSASQDAAMQLPIGCFGTVTASADNCVITLDTNCPGATGYRVIQRGKVTWAPNGASGAGTIQTVVTIEATGAQYCSSVYDVSERKL